MISSIWSFGNSREVKKERSRDNALFLPSEGIPWRIFFITGGYMSGVIVRPFRSTPCPSYFFSISFGFDFSASCNAFSNNKVASPSIESGMNEYVFVIFRGSASEGLKFSSWSFVMGIEAYAVFSCKEYGARKRWRGETRTMSIASVVDLIVISSLNCFCKFSCLTPPNEEIASSLAVLFLHDSQKSISLSSTIFIFVLHPGQSIAILFFVKLSISDLHFMFGQTYL